MAYDLITFRGTPVYNGADVKYGAGALSGGSLKSSGTKPDLFLSSTGADGGSFATGTLECWVKAATPSAVKVIAGHLGWYYLKCDSSGNAGAEVGGVMANKKTITTTTKIADGNWHHVALVITPTAATIYVDGVQAGTTTYTSSNTTAADTSSGGDLNFTVGDYGTSTSFMWPGAVDEVRLSDVARYTASFTAPTTAFTSDANTVALWHLDGSGADSGRTVGGGSPTPVTALSVLRGAATYAAPKFGTSAETGAVLTGAGADTFLSASGADGGALATGTIEGWVKATSTGATRVAFGHSSWYWVGHDASGYAAANYGTSDSGQTEQTLRSTTPINDGNWHHVALVLSAGAGSLYVDGQQVATSAVTKSTGTSSVPFSIGGFGDSTKTAFDWTGAVDEVRTSSVARYTGAYTAPTSAFTADANAGGLFHLDDYTQTSANIAPNDANLVYSPYNWVVTSTQAEAVNSGAYVRAMFAGSVTQIVANFDTSNLATPTPYITYRVDNGAWTRVKIATALTLTMPSNGWAKHVVELVVSATTETQNRWTAPRAATVKFIGFTTNPTTATTLPVTPRSLRVLIYGDSITEGVRTLSAATGDDVNRNDVLVDYSWALREALGAEVGIVGFGRQGWDRTGNGSVPALKDAYNLVFAGATRSFVPAPDLIVIAHGTNDTASVTATGLVVVNALLAATPATTRIVLLRPFVGTAREAELQAVAAGCSTPSRVRYVSTEGWWTSADAGDSVHPYGFAHVTSIGPRAASAARNLLARGQTVMRQADGSTKPVTGRRL